MPYLTLLDTEPQAESAPALLITGTGLYLAGGCLPWLALLLPFILLLAGVAVCGRIY